MSAAPPNAWLRRATRVDLAFARDDARIFLPLMTAALAFLAALALFAALVAAGSAARWRGGLEGKLTVEIPAGPALAERGAAALAALEGDPAVARAAIVPGERVAVWLAPWLGEGVAAADLPLPRLIEVELAPGANVDPAALAARLAAASPGAILDNHGAWTGRLLAAARLAVGAAIAIMALVGATASFAVVFATRAGFAVHRDTIEMLHLMGAHDGYIARQFAVENVKRALLGGAIGAALAAAAGAASLRVIAGLDPGLAEAATLDWTGWAALAATPLAAAAIAGATAGVAALRALARLP